MRLRATWSYSRLIALMAALFLFLGQVEPVTAQKGSQRGFTDGAKKNPLMPRIKELEARTKSLLDQGDYPGAENLARSRLELSARAFGENHRNYAGALNLLGRVLLAEGHYGEAAALMRRGLTLRELNFGATDLRISNSLLQLGQLLAAQDNYAESETMLRRAVTIRAASGLPSEHSKALLALGQLMKDLGRYAEAEALAKQTITVLEGALPGQKSGQIAMALYLLAQCQDEQGWPDQAYPLAVRALAIQERVRGPRHPDTGLSLIFIGRLLRELQRNDEALPLLDRARTVLDQRLGGRHPQTGRVHLELALAQDAMGERASAEQNYQAALKILRNGAVPLLLAQSSRAYGRYLVSHERLREALPYYRVAVSVVERVFAETSGQSEEIRQDFAMRFNAYHHELIELLIRLHAEDAGAGHNREAIAVTSLMQSRIFSELLRQDDVKSFSRDPGFTKLNQQRIASVDRLRALRRGLVAGGSLERETADEEDGDENADAGVRTDPVISVQQQDARTENLRRQIDEAKQQLGRAEEALRRSYPRYMELTQPQPVTVAELQQRLLRPGEAVLTYAMLPRQLVVFAASREEFVMAVLPQSRDGLTAKIRAVRASEEQTGSINDLQKLDPAQLHELYRLLIAPVESVLGKAQRLLVVGDGPIHTLPLEMLVMRYGDAERTAFAAARARGPMLAEYATLPYLGARTHLNYLPSLAAIASQRLYAKPAVTYDREIVSFADPVFEPEAGGQGIGAPTRAALQSLTRSVRSGGPAISIPRLPETADEARAIARILGGKSQLYLRHDAQEHTAKSLDLRTTRYLHFATHGFLGGEFLMVQQAGRERAIAGTQGRRDLVITKPAANAASAGSSATGQNYAAIAGESVNRGRGGQPALALTLVGNLRGEDGLLTMNEVIEKLDLNAQLVVLAACNTAGEGAEAHNGEGFAGLTRSFMYAGAKALLVSHWSVESLSTEQFVTTVFQNIKQGRTIGDAVFEARRSILASSTADYSRAHPYFWAPFVYVGD